MFSVQLTTFLISWRGFLLEGRRNWHAHHRLEVMGTRGKYLLSAPGFHYHQLTRVVRLVDCFFQRGAPLWVFGVVDRKQRRPWGILYAGWRPGVLSNYFFVRVRRVHFARRVNRIRRFRYRGRHSVRRLRRRRRFKLATRWARLRTRSQLPPTVYTTRAARRVAAAAGYAGVVQNFTRAAFAGGSRHFQNWHLVTAWRAAPRVARLRSSYFRRWWRFAARYTRLVRRPGSLFSVFRGGLNCMATPALRNSFATAVTARQRVRKLRVTSVGWQTWRLGAHLSGYHYGTLRGWYRRVPTFPRRGRRLTPALVARCATWPSRFPAGAIAGGLTLVGSNLVHEVNGAGLPFLHFGGSDFTPTAAVWHVSWNQSLGALRGVGYLCDAIWKVSYRRGLLLILWRRLNTKLPS